MAAHCVDESRRHVAYLHLYHDNFPQRVRPVQAGDAFDIGRKDLHKFWGSDEPTVSLHHLRFHCIAFDGTEAGNVPPLVYVRVLSFNPIALLGPSGSNSSVCSILSKPDNDVLLNHGDVLQLTSSISISFRLAARFQYTQPLAAIRRAETRHFKKQYKVTDRVLGHGGQATVHLASRQSDGRQLACKIVAVKNSTDEGGSSGAREDRLAREYDILKDLSHPNIISLEQVVYATYNIYIFQELITGGDLYSCISGDRRLSEPEIVVIVRQVLKAVDYLHDRGIVHRDIKPENVLVTSWRPGARVVLSDFGQSRFMQPVTKTADSALARMQSIVGTRGYFAPEMYGLRTHASECRAGYSKAIDIWGVGCLAATCLTSDALFPDDDKLVRTPDDEDPVDTAHLLYRLRIIDEGEQWQAFGRAAKSFVKGCLLVDECSRLTAKEALSHIWFTNKHYVTEIEGAYDRAIAAWKPRNSTANLVQFIDTRHVASAESGANNTERLVEETKSRHFHERAPQMSSSNALNRFQLHLPRPRLAHTPLPCISEKSDSEPLETPTAEHIARQEALLPTQDFVPNTPPAQVQTLNNDDAARYSISAFGPPMSHTSPHCARSTTELEGEDSITQSEYSSASRLPAPMRPALLPANAKKRLSAFSGLAETDKRQRYTSCA